MSYLVAAAVVVGLIGWTVHRLRIWFEVSPTGRFLLAIFRFHTGWHHTGKPGRGRRAARRCGITAGAVLLLAVIFAAPATAQWLIALLLTAGTVLGTFWLVRQVRGYRHQHVWLRPLHLAAHDVAQIDPRRSPSSWLQVEPDRSRAVLALPSGWAGEPGEKQRLVTIASAKLGMEQPEVSWRLAGEKPQLALTMSAPPPALVRCDDLMEEIVKARPGEFVCGTGRRGQLVKVSLSQSPHFAINSGSGGGKSAVASFWGMQALRRGGVLMVLDNKWQSLPWTFKDERGEYDYLPNVAYLSSPAQIHAGLVWLGDELARRNQVARRAVTASGSLRGDVGPPIFVVAEELNLAIPLVRQYWADTRSPDDVRRSPALAALGSVAFAGRAVKMHLILIGQMLTAAATGAPDSSVKENVGIMAMARYGAAGWNTMVGRDVPMPPSPVVVGRFQIVSPTGVRETQMPIPDGVLYRQLVLEGDVVPCPAGMPGARVPDRLPVLAGGSEQAVVSETLPPLGQPGSRVILAEAVGEGIWPGSLTAIRKASQRPGFPPVLGRRGVAGEYDAVALAEFVRGRRW
jgi:hypothetical protein